MNAIPYVIPYGGKKTDVFSAEDVADIDRLYASFTQKVLELTGAKNLLGSKKVEDWVAKSLGGTVKFEKYVKSNPSRFFTVDNIVSTCHPEVPINKKTWNARFPQHCKTWDEMHSLVKMHHYGDEATPCTVAMDIFNGVADSAAWQLMESSMKELHERNRQRQLKLVELGLSFPR